MNNIVLYCKSYLGDLDRAEVLTESVRKFNVENIPFYISVPTAHVSEFRGRLGSGVNIVEDESIYDHKAEESWHTQQIVKSNFWKLGLCKNYLMIDSDSYFIRPFYIKDFIVEGTLDTPYTVMHEQKDLFIWSCNKKSILGFDPYEGFKNDREKIMNLFQRKGRLYDFGPGPIIWNYKVWQSLQDEYLTPNKLKFSDLIKEVASEFTWYGECLLASQCIPIWPIEPIFKFFHYPHQYQDFKRFGYSEQDFSKNYLGIVMQSNWRAPLKY